MSRFNPVRISGVRGPHTLRLRGYALALVSIRCGFLGSGDLPMFSLAIGSLVSIRCGFLGSGDRWERRCVTSRWSFNPVRISGVRGLCPRDKRRAYFAIRSFNPVRISGVRGQHPGLWGC